MNHSEFGQMRREERLRARRRNFPFGIAQAGTHGDPSRAEIALEPRLRVGRARLWTSVQDLRPSR